MARKNKYNFISDGEKVNLDEDYKKVIDLIINDEVDWKKLCIQIAKEHPDIFVKCIEANKEEPKELSWEAQVKQYAKSNPNKKINCIKLCRQLTNWGLAEAKNWVDNNCDYRPPSDLF